MKTGSFEAAVLFITVLLLLTLTMALHYGNPTSLLKSVNNTAEAHRSNKRLRIMHE